MVGTCQIPILDKSTSHESNHEERADKPKLRDRPQNSLQKVMEVKERCSIILD